MSKILHAKQSRCLKSKHLLVLIYIKQNLGKDLLNYLVVEIIFCLYTLKVSKGRRQSPAPIGISPEQLTFMELQVKTSVSFPISNLNTASRNYLGTKCCSKSKVEKKILKKLKVYVIHLCIWCVACILSHCCGWNAMFAACNTWNNSRSQVLLFHTGANLQRLHRKPLKKWITAGLQNSASQP